jgi:hypothetical protein
MAIHTFSLRQKTPSGLFQDSPGKLPLKSFYSTYKNAKSPGIAHWKFLPRASSAPALSRMLEGYRYRPPFGGQSIPYRFAARRSSRSIILQKMLSTVPALQE